MVSPMRLTWRAAWRDMSMRLPCSAASAVFRAHGGAGAMSLRDEIEQLLGEDTVWFSGGNGFPRHADEE